MANSKELWVGRSEDFELNRAVSVDVDGVRVLIVRTPTRLFALADSCPHQSRSLGLGTVEGDTIRCAFHRVCVALDSGEIVDDAGHLGLEKVQTFGVSERDGDVYVTSSASR